MNKKEFEKEKEQIEKDIVAMLKKTKSDFTLEHVKDIIYNEEESDDYNNVVALFDRGGDISELENVLDLVSDAWNHFPHKALNGLSPQEKLLEYEDNIKL